MQLLVADLPTSFLANIFVRIFHRMVRSIILSFLILGLSCSKAHKESNELISEPSENASYEPLILAKPLLASRFKSFDDFKSKVLIKYFTNSNSSNSKVLLKLKNNNTVTNCKLESGLSQDDIFKAKSGSILDKIKLTIKSPFAIRNRKNLEKAFLLARRKKRMFSYRDIAFYDLALALTKHINDKELAYKNAKDSGEKGYINTFNHVAAQAIITSFFSKELASFMADVHERKNMKELTTGKFTPEQLKDTTNYPEDNYVDIINNVIGQKLGMALKNKYKINRNEKCSSVLMANYLNDLQSYFSWSLGTGFEPFHASDEIVVRFAHKLNVALR